MTLSIFDAEPREPDTRGVYLGAIPISLWALWSFFRVMRVPRGLRDPIGDLTIMLLLLSMLCAPALLMFFIRAIHEDMRFAGKLWIFVALVGSLGAYALFVAGIAQALALSPGVAGHRM